MAYNTATGIVEYTYSKNTDVYSFGYSAYNSTDILVTVKNLDNGIDPIHDVSFPPSDGGIDYFSVEFIGVTAPDGAPGSITFVWDQATKDLVDGLNIVIQRVLPITRTVNYLRDGEITDILLNSDNNYETYLIDDLDNKISLTTTEEAPRDGNIYGRKDGAWVIIPTA